MYFLLNVSFFPLILYSVNWGKIISPFIYYHIKQQVNHLNFTHNFISLLRLFLLYVSNVGMKLYSAAQMDH